MDFDLLAIGQAEVFVEFDSLTVDFAAERFGHGSFLPFVAVLKHFTKDMLLHYEAD